MGTLVDIFFVFALTLVVYLITNTLFLTVSASGDPKFRPKTTSSRNKNTRGLKKPQTQEAVFQVQISRSTEEEVDVKESVVGGGDELVSQVVDQSSNVQGLDGVVENMIDKIPLVENAEIPQRVEVVEDGENGETQQRVEVVEDRDNNADIPQTFELVEDGQNTEIRQRLDLADDGENAETPQRVELVEVGKIAEIPHRVELVDDGQNDETPQWVEVVNDGENAETQHRVEVVEDGERVKLVENGYNVEILQRVELVGNGQNAEIPQRVELLDDGENAETHQRVEVVEDGENVEIPQRFEVAEENDCVVGTECDLGNVGGEQNNNDKERWLDLDEWEGIESTELDRQFGAAIAFVGSKTYAARVFLGIESNVKMELYALQKVAIEGPCTKPPPMALKVFARAKWNAWKQLEDMSREKAMGEYIALLSRIIPDWMEDGTTNARTNKPCFAERDVNRARGS